MKAQLGFAWFAWLDACNRVSATSTGHEQQYYGWAESYTLQEAFSGGVCMMHIRGKIAVHRRVAKGLVIRQPVLNEQDLRLAGLR